MNEPKPPKGYVYEWVVEGAETAAALKGWARVPASRHAADGGVTRYGCRLMQIPEADHQRTVAELLGYAEKQVRDAEADIAWRFAQELPGGYRVETGFNDIESYTEIWSSDMDDTGIRIPEGAPERWKL